MFVDLHATNGRRGYSGEDLPENGLAATGRTNDAKAITRRQTERDALQQVVG
jgi:hypothetical protein